MDLQFSDLPIACLSPKPYLLSLCRMCPVCSARPVGHGYWKTCVRHATKRSQSDIELIFSYDIKERDKCPFRHSPITCPFLSSSWSALDTRCKTIRFLREIIWQMHSVLFWSNCVHWAASAGPGWVWRGRSPCRPKTVSVFPLQNVVPSVNHGHPYHLCHPGLG